MTAAARIVVATALATGVAAADPIDLGPARLTLDDSWRGPAVATEPVTAVARRAGPVQLFAVRYDVPNLEAWRDATRPPHVAAIVAGFAQAPGYAALGQRVHRLGAGGVPTLDLTFRRQGPTGPELVAVRVLLFRTTTIAAIAAAPAERATVERAVAALTPE